ncbi:protein YLS3 isoform X2 [Herrania umbratica]|uniref:Protein YLS3 isoform X2 n=1 Tax=Herrania umbratica TaxID=108875 RepID=A0A6J1A7E7_9ROSI|nr:protein YLS3 isoform X2 [Herrania umbratica]
MSIFPYPKNLESTRENNSSFSPNQVRVLAMYITQFPYNLKPTSLLTSPYLSEMGVLSSVRVTLCCFIFLILLSCVSSDLAEDKKECSNQLVAVSTCIPFIGGKTKVPDPTCCTNLRKILNQTKKCLCLLVADRNDPDLGFKVNATLALILPSICHAPSNASECPELLHLPPNSTDAQVFKQFAATFEEGNSSAVDVTGTSTSSSSSVREEGWVGVWKIGRILTWQLLSIYIIDM